MSTVVVPITEGVSLKELLSPRQFETVSYLAEGLTNQNIASAMQVSIWTVKRHLNASYGKMGYRGQRYKNRVAAAFRYRRECQPWLGQ
jgi:DNA-binding NarL/FixJ family response regulator